MDSPVERVPYPDHPNRCQGMAKDEQCIMFAVETGTMCMLHGGNRQLEVLRNQSLKNYHLTRFRAEVHRLGSSNEIKSLRDEIGILRMLMETRLNQCRDVTDLLLQSGPIADLVMKIDRVVGSCHKLEGSMGELLDKTAILQFAHEVIGIVTEEITDKLVVNCIADRILNILGRLNAPQ